MTAQAQNRLARIAREMQRVLSSILYREMSDPRLHGVHVVSVELSKDLRHARVRVSFSESDRAEEVLKALRTAAGYIQSKLAEQMTLRIVPRLSFDQDIWTKLMAGVEAKMRLLDRADGEV